MKNALAKTVNESLGITLPIVVVPCHKISLAAFQERRRILIASIMRLTAYPIRQPKDPLTIINCRDGSSSNVQYTRLNQLHSLQSMFLDVPRPVPTSKELKSWFAAQRQEHFDHQMLQAAFKGTSVLLRACHPITPRPDPILYLPMTRAARSRLVRWRLGRFSNMNEECPCQNGERISRDHFVYSCRVMPQDLISRLPGAPPNINRIDYALNHLPQKATKGPPHYWSALLEVLHTIDTLCHPLATIAPDPDPGDDWFAL